MKALTDRGLLLAFCMFSLMFSPTENWFLTALFLSVSCTCLNYYFDKKALTWCLSLVQSAIACMVPEFCLFLPFVVYDTGLFLPPAVLLIQVFAILASWNQVSFYQFLYEIFGCILALYLKYEHVQHETMRKTFLKSRDDSTELNLLLEEKNKTLREKQDYEIYAATLKERNRIAREIHDNVGHLLSRSILMVGALRTVNQSELLKEPLAQLENTLSTAMSSIRQSVHDLHDNSISLEQSAKNVLQDFTYCPVTFTYDMSLEVPKDIKYCFLAIMKEALTNILRHSNASQASVVMREHPGLYQLIILDNGICSLEESNPGIGLLNMKDRVQALRGNISFHTDRGFSIYVTIPKEPLQ